MPHVDVAKYKLNRILEALLLIIGFGIAAHNLGLLIILFFDHSGLIFGMEFVFPPMYLPFKLLMLLLHAFAITGLCIGNAFVLGAICTYVFQITLFVTVELRVGLKENRYNSLSILRQNSNILQIEFRALQILHKNILCWLGPYVLLMHGAFMTAAIFFNFILIRYGGKLDPLYRIPIILGLVLCLGIWTSVIEISRVLNSRGNKVLSSWGGDKWGNSFNNKLMKRFRRSCKPLVVAYGTQFVMGKGTIFVF